MVQPHGVDSMMKVSASRIDGGKISPFVRVLGVYNKKESIIRKG
jgi:hypothetical protein